MTKRPLPSPYVVGGILVILQGALQALQDTLDRLNPGFHRVKTFLDGGRRLGSHGRSPLVESLLDCGDEVTVNLEVILVRHRALACRNLDSHEVSGQGANMELRVYLIGALKQGLMGDSHVVDLLSGLDTPGIVKFSIPLFALCKGRILL